MDVISSTSGSLSPGEPPENGVPDVGGDTPPFPAGLNILPGEAGKGGGEPGSSAGEDGPLEKAGGLILFSFCLLDQQCKWDMRFDKEFGAFSVKTERNTKICAYLLQNHTLTTSFSMLRLLATYVISSDVGLGF